MFRWLIPHTGKVFFHVLHELPLIICLLSEMSHVVARVFSHGFSCRVNRNSFMLNGARQQFLGYCSTSLRDRIYIRHHISICNRSLNKSKVPSYPSKGILRIFDTCTGVHRTKFATALRATSSQFAVGDHVIIDWSEKGNDSSYQSGVIEEAKKNGWYTICLDSDTIRVKRRSVQLRKKNIGDYTWKTPMEIKDNGHDVPSPSMKIINLDFILENQPQSRYDEVEYESLNSGSYTSSDSTTIMESKEQILSCHSKYNRWIVFSDLHVMPSSLTSSLQVLEYVHKTALERNAGILFLGDFWHHRGFIRVDCLNAILEVMSKWRVPCILIPGNHDQINWGGTEHALNPLRNAYRINPPETAGEKLSPDQKSDSRKQYPGPLIFSHPTKFQDALFIPHIRDKKSMMSILKSNEAIQSSALFLHADVKGASMNDLIKSQHGLSASLFPPVRHIYSGHFHKPHVVNASTKASAPISVRYVGSSYQTSLSEAGQSKFLLLVDSKQGWGCIEEIPIDVGPRYHRVSTIPQLFEMSKNNTLLRPGDKVVVTVPQSNLDEIGANTRGSILVGNPLLESISSSFYDKIKELRRADVAVEIRNVQHPSMVTENTLLDLSLRSNDDKNVFEFEELSPEATLKSYIDNEVAENKMGELTAKHIFDEGETLLRELRNESSEKVYPLSAKSATHIEFDSVSIVGYGPFREIIEYPLNNRGVVLLRGTNKDFGSDSNGVGKSTLAMASLWALIGSADPRPVQDGKVVDIVNDFSKSAEVTLRGSLNSKPFLVKRSKSLSPGFSLTFILDGSDLTLQSPRDTQSLINEYFRTESQVLMRSIFHGQHSIGNLLESSDAKLKDELSCLISLDTWQRLASLARSKQRDLLRRVSELDGMISIRLKDSERALERCRTAEDDMNSKKNTLEQTRIKTDHQGKSNDTTDATLVYDTMNLIQTELHELSLTINCLEDENSKLVSSDSNKLLLLRSQLSEKLADETELKAALHFVRRQCDQKNVELESAEKQLSNIKVERNLSIGNGGSPTFGSYEPTCRTCGQKISSPEVQHQVMKSISEKVDAAKYQVKEAHDSLEVAITKHREAQEKLGAMEAQVQCLRELLHEAEAKAEESLALRSNELREKLKKARLLQLERSSKLANLAERAKEISQIEIAKSRIQSELNRLNDDINASIAYYEACCAEFDVIQSSIDEIQKEKEHLTSKASVASLLVDSFGSKGIQAFVLRNVVHALQFYSQSYIDELSDGSLQLRLQVGSNDSIIKQAAVRNPDGSWRIRPLSSLSGGQWRRCSLGLSLGFIELVSNRDKMRSSLLVLDEPLTHLDSAGRASVGKLLRKMLVDEITSSDTVSRRLGGLGLSTILVILQDIAAEEIEECFDQIDEVIKSNGESHVALDKNTVPAICNSKIQIV